MRSWMTDQFGIEVPVAAFSHCRDVVAAVTNAGGLGVLGAVTYTPDELELELRWLDEHTGGHPYGVDLLVPATYAMSNETAEELSARIPPEHIQFVDDLLHEYDVLDPEEHFEVLPRIPGEAPEVVEACLDVAFDHDIALIANALGPAPRSLIEKAGSHGVPVAALVGTVDHALKQQAAGVDLIVAQGYEAGGHTGEITTMVLTPEVVAAVSPTPVLAAGGIATGRQLAAALALGAVGAWTGSVWLTTDEAETDPIVKEKFVQARSSDTLRSRARTGKPARQLKTKWHEAWERPDTPNPLPMPLQGLLAIPAFRRISAAAQAGVAGAQELDSYFVGQLVGLIHQRVPVKTVMYDFMEGLVEAAAQLQAAVEG